MSEERKDRCENCRFWEDLDPTDLEINTGLCHRYPPTTPSTAKQERESLSIDTLGLWRGWFVETENDDWCGEFQARK